MRTPTKMQRTVRAAEFTDNKKGVRRSSTLSIPMTAGGVNCQELTLIGSFHRMSQIDETGPFLQCLCNIRPSDVPGTADRGGAGAVVEVPSRRLSGTELCH